MKIIDIALHNFQGLRDFNLTLNGENASIYGDNGVGKTTIFNAFTWLLFDKPSTTGKNFTPKTRGLEGDEHGIEHSATITFEHNGAILKLQKVFKEVYTKKRGSITAVFDGHEVLYYINDVPTKEKDFRAKVTSEFSIEQLMAMAIPHYFPEMLSWQQRREILLSICGDISDIEVINSNEGLLELLELLKINGGTQLLSVNELKVTLASKLKKINSDLSMLPSRIDEANRALFDVGPVSIQDIKNAIVELNEQKSSYEQAKLDTKNSNKMKSLIEDNIRELEIAYSNGKVEQVKFAMAQNSDIEHKIFTLSSKQSDIKKGISNNEFEIRNLKELIVSKINLRNQLLKEYSELKATEFLEDTQNCPVCKQPLPAHEIRKLREQFNINKSERLAEINRKGKIDASEDLIEKLKSDLQGLEDTQAQKKVELDALTKEIISMKEKIVIVPAFDQTEKAKKIVEDISLERDKFKNIQAEIDKELEFVQSQITNINSLIREQMSMQERIKANELQHKRISELKNMQTELSEKYETYEKGIFLCEEFIKAKVRLLDERINSKFDTVKFRLFSEQVNGGVKEDCEVLVKTNEGVLVPFTFANNAGRINAGLEIIGALSEHWGIEMPIFVDNAESITKLTNVHSQVIQLIVSEKHKVLTCVVE